MLDRIPGWIEEGLDLAHLETGEPIVGVAGRLVAANVYLGAQADRRGPASGRGSCSTGRVADASLTLGPAVAHFGWDWDDWERLAGASTAGHLIECGAQATGGLWSGWPRSRTSPASAIRSPRSMTMARSRSPSRPGPAAG